MIENLAIAGLMLLLIMIIILGRLLINFKGKKAESFPAWNRYLTNMQRKLLRANLYMRAEEMILVCLILALVFFLSALGFGYGFLPAMVLAIAGFAIPGIVLDLRRRNSLRKLEKQLPIVLAIIADAMRSGNSFAQALEIVYKDTMPPLSEECGRVLRDNRLGRPMAEALRRMARRVGSDDLDIVINALEIQRQLGGNMAVLLTKLEQNLRERSELESDIKALTAQQRLSALVIFLLPVFLVIFLLLTSPGYLKPLLEEPAGQNILAVAVSAQLLGLLVVYRFMKLKF